MTESRLSDEDEALFQSARATADSGDLAAATDMAERLVARNLTALAPLRLAAELYRLASRFHDRVKVAEQIATLAPDLPAAWQNLALAYADTGDLQALRAASTRAISLQPDEASLHYLRATALLRDGDFEAGLREYEWRLKVPGTSGGMPPDDWPRWDGDPMPDRRLLIFCDQGRGDIIQFARYIPWVADRCPDLAVCCPSEMWPILRQFPRVGTLVEHWHQAGDCGAFVPIGSLPFVFGTRVGTVPAPIPYLRANPALVAAWRARLDRLLPRNYPRVGLVWAGNPSHHNDRARSLAAAQLRPLFNVRNVAFVSMQWGDAHTQLSQVFGRAPMVNAFPEMGGFGDTMALLEAIDLLISVDTSVAHLAGAMGCPAWVLLPHAADWRWLAGRETSPWYPTMRLFQQAENLVWEPVITRVAAELSHVGVRDPTTPMVIEPAMPPRPSQPSIDRLRAICVALPEALEKETWDNPTFRVGDKIFAMVHAADGAPSVWCKAPPGAQAILVEAGPERFFRPPYVGSKGWIGIWLNDGVDWEEMAALIRRSYGMTAPKKLLKDQQFSL